MSISFPLERGGAFRPLVAAGVFQFVACLGFLCGAEPGPELVAAAVKENVAAEANSEAEETDTKEATEITIEEAEEFGDDAAGTDVYYLAVFSSQGAPKIPNRTHNWGVAVHARVDGDRREIVASDAISWMPRTLSINMLRLRIEQGVNLTHEQTIAHAARTGQRVSLWGVYQITPEAYQRFHQQRTRLLAGRYGYQCLDTIGEAGNRRNGVNCVHALSDFANILPHIPVAVQPFGDESAAVIARTLERRELVVDLNADISWVVNQMKWSTSRYVHRLSKFSPATPAEIVISNEIVTNDLSAEERRAPSPAKR